MIFLAANFTNSLLKLLQKFTRKPWCLMLINATLKQRR